jgi:cullin-associated NEDD8-dissociated protein 1
MRKVNKALMTKMLVAATLASSMSDDLLARATITVVQILKNKEVKPEMTRTNIQMIGAFW